MELKLVPVLTSRLDLWHNCLIPSQSTGVPSTSAIILSMVDTTVHDNSSISQITGLMCWLSLDTAAPSNGDEFITSVAPDCTWNGREKFGQCPKQWEFVNLVYNWYNSPLENEKVLNKFQKNCTNGILSKKYKLIAYLFKNTQGRRKAFCRPLPFY